TEHSAGSAEKCLDQARSDRRERNPSCSLPQQAVLVERGQGRQSIRGIALENLHVRRTSTHRRRTPAALVPRAGSGPRRGLAGEVEEGRTASTSEDSVDTELIVQPPAGASAPEVGCEYESETQDACLRDDRP